MRNDAHGFFWNDTDYKTEKKQDLLIEQGWVEVFSGFWAEQYKLDKGADIRDICEGIDTAYTIARANKTGEKRTPPEPTWLAPDYLPGLEESKAFNIGLITDEELIDYSLDVYRTGKKHVLIYDIECYGNYFMIGMMSYTTGKVTTLEFSEDVALNTGKLRWIFDNFCMVGFHSNGYDIYIASMAVEGCSTAQMKCATSMIIEEQQRGYMALRHYKVKQIKCDHIDIIEVAPLFGSLKIYGGRMHCKRMQDLPFHPDTVLTRDQRTITKWYCVNDLRLTAQLYSRIQKELTLREEMGIEYQQDLRSRSDAQIAEHVIGKQVEYLNGFRPHKPIIHPGTSYRYNIPAFIQYGTPLMNGVLETIRYSNFIVGEHGGVGLPKELKELKITMNKTTYTMGIGGLHSTEKKAAHFAGPDCRLIDRDVISYYPRIILNLGLYPYHLGPAFLTVFGELVARRLIAIGQDRKSLKIVINGSFGKLGSKYSILYAPDLLIQVTLTGQLSLLMLIERLELAGIPVVSANTDGIVIKCPNRLDQQMDAVVKQWEIDTSFETEETLYKSLYSRDVNNYIAVKEPSTWKNTDTLDDRVKTKGVFAKTGLSKNPQNEICFLAVKELLINEKPIQATIRECQDITKFVTIRTVRGGAVKLYGEGIPNLYLGKAIRWYYAKDLGGEIVYAASGNIVPRSHGAKPMMDLLDIFPQDIDYDWYEKETLKILKQIGYDN